jgi:hypothetical protein
MRRSILLVLASSLVLAVGAPAEAAKPTRTVHDSVSANAFWYFEEQPSRNTIVRTTWYVGVYRSTDGIWSDLYVDTSTCTIGPRGEKCTYGSKFGFSDLSTGTFTINEDGLTAAHLEETYLLQSWDERGETSESTPATIVADWTGIGDLQENSGRSSYCDQFWCSKSTWDEAFRSAEASGTVNGDDLGETYDAYLSRYHSVTTESPR